MLQILAIGDIVGTQTIEVLRNTLWKKRDEWHVDLSLPTEKTPQASTALAAAMRKRFLIAALT